MQLPERVKKAGISSWGYYPIYLWKNREVKRIASSLPKKSRVLDAGCGEGFLVEELNRMGFDSVGVDISHSGERVKRGSITSLPFADSRFDLVLCLDVLEYLPAAGQKKALSELQRVGRKGAPIVITFPNQAHFAARAIKLIKGRLPPTDKKTPCAGDMPFTQFKCLLEDSGLQILKIKPCLPTYCLVSTALITGLPTRFHWLLQGVNKFAIPNLSFLNLFVCMKK